MFDKRKFLAQMVLKGITQKKLAEKLGIDESTLYRKINNDGRFTRKEMNDIIIFLDIKDPTPIFFADELT